MAFLGPPFENDVFVSYSHGILGADSAPLRDWTLDLIGNLETAIRNTDPQLADLLMWRDEHNDPTKQLTPELREKVTGSAILMIVMSPWYLASTWCKDELEWFRGQVLEREGHGRGRVFVVRAIRTDESKWPDFLRDDRGQALPGFWFHDRRDERPLPPYGFFGGGKKDEAYNKAMATLLTWLVRRLWELRERAASDQAAKPLTSGESSTGTKLIYVHSRPEYAAVYDKVKQTLSQDRIEPIRAPVPPASKIVDLKEESRDRIKAAKECDALALVRADGDERFMGDLLQIGWKERDLIEAARGAPLPCAVLDCSPQALPVDLSDHGIERFDLSNNDWHGKFRGWLDQTRTPPASVP